MVSGDTTAPLLVNAHSVSQQLRVAMVYFICEAALCHPQDAVRNARFLCIPSFFVQSAAQLEFGC